MFTGLIHHLGRIESVQQSNGLVQLWISCAFPWNELAVGASISVNGICLTVEKRRFWPRAFRVTAVQETLDRTHLSSWRVHQKVHLECSLKPSSSLGGHFVSGHVDGVGRVLQKAPRLRVSIPADLYRFLPMKGSVALDGVSLTIAKSSPEYIEVALIPETLGRTRFSSLEIGDPVHIEIDLLARYLHHSSHEFSS